MCGARTKRPRNVIPAATEYGPDDIVFFRDADNIVFASVPKDIYEEEVSSLAEPVA